MFEESCFSVETVSAFRPERRARGPVGELPLGSLRSVLGALWGVGQRSRYLGRPNPPQTRACACLLGVESRELPPERHLLCDLERSHNRLITSDAGV